MSEKACCAFFAVTGRTGWRLSGDVDEARTMVPYMSCSPPWVGASGRRGGWSSKPVRSAKGRPGLRLHSRCPDGDGRTDARGFVGPTGAGCCQFRNHRRPHSRETDLVHRGLRTQVIPLAYRQRTLPQIEGVVQTVSVHRLVDQVTGEPYFLARIEVDPAALEGP